MIREPAKLAGVGFVLATAAPPRLGSAATPWDGGIPLSDDSASLRLARDHIAAVAGLRGMFWQSGSIVAVSISTAVLARSADAGMTHAHIFLAFAILLVCVTLLVYFVPDQRGKW